MAVQLNRSQQASGVQSGCDAYAYNRRLICGSGEVTVQGVFAEVEGCAKGKVFVKGSGWEKKAVHGWLQAASGAASA